MSDVTIAKFNNTEVFPCAFDNLKYRVTIDTAPLCSFRLAGFCGSSWMDFMSITICGLEGGQLLEDGKGLMHSVADVFEQLGSEGAILPFENMAGGPDLSIISQSFTELAKNYRVMGNKGSFVHITKKHHMSFDMSNGTIETICVTVEPVLRTAQLLNKEQIAELEAQAQAQADMLAKQDAAGGFQPGLNPGDSSRNLMYAEREMAVNELQEDLQDMINAGQLNGIAPTQY